MLITFISLHLASCQLPQHSEPAPQSQPSQKTAPTAAPAATQRSAEPRIDISEASTAAAASAIVASLPEVTDLRTRREIRLHAALYRLAIAGIVADNTRNVLLQPMPASDLPDQAISDREFYLRVLAALAPLDRPIAWTTVEPPSADAPEYFPGSSDLATRVSFEIITRDDDSATVLAAVADTTAHSGSSRQRVIATFDGRDWHTTRDGPRLIW
jgi:hypothetical protein